MKKIRIIGLLGFVLCGLFVFAQPETYTAQKTYIDNNIKTNGVGSITGAIANTAFNYLLRNSQLYEYDITRPYKLGQVTVKDSVIYQALVDMTAGAWDSTKWYSLSLDTTSLSDRINLKQDISDTSVYDASRWYVDSSIVAIIDTGYIHSTGGNDTLWQPFYINGNLYFINTSAVIEGNSIEIRTRANTTATAPTVIRTGNSSAANSGAVGIYSGTGATNSGQVDIYSSQGGMQSGAIRIFTGGGTSITSGSIEIYPGDGVTTDGNIKIGKAGSVTGNLSANVNSKTAILMRDTTTGIVFDNVKIPATMITGLASGDSSWIVATADTLIIKSPYGANGKICHNSFYGGIRFLNSSNKMLAAINSDGSHGGQLIIYDPYYNKSFQIDIGDSAVRMFSNNKDTIKIYNKIILLSGAAINEFSTDTTMSGNSNNAIPTEMAVKSYVDNHNNYDIATIDTLITSKIKPSSEGVFTIFDTSSVPKSMFYLAPSIVAVSDPISQTDYMTVDKTGCMQLTHYNGKTTFLSCGNGELLVEDSLNNYRFEVNQEQKYIRWENNDKVFFGTDSIEGTKIRYINYDADQDTILCYNPITGDITSKILSVSISSISNLQDSLNVKQNDNDTIPWDATKGYVNKADHDTAAALRTLIGGYWSNTLDALPDSTTNNKFGSSTSYPIDFYTNNTLRWRMQGGTGFLGFGTTTPSAPLHVARNVNSFTGGKCAQITNSSTGSSAYTTLQIGNNTADFIGVLGVTGSANIANIATIGGNGVFLTSNSTAYKVGIGVNLGCQIIASSATTVGFFTGATTYNINIDGQAAKTMGMIRNTTANTAGTSFTINSSGATSGANNKSGGDLILAPGVKTGIFSNSSVRVQTYGSNASSTSDNSLYDRASFMSCESVIDNTLDTLFRVTLGNDSMFTGTLNYNVRVIDNDSNQMEKGYYELMYIRTGNTGLSNTDPQVMKQVLENGTLTTTFSYIFDYTNSYLYVCVNVNSTTHQALTTRGNMFVRGDLIGMGGRFTNLTEF